MGQSVTFDFFLKDYFSKVMQEAGKVSQQVLGKIQQDLDNTDKKSQKAGKAMKDGVMSPLDGITSLAGKLGVAFGVGALIKGVGGLGITAEQTEIAFTTMLGSADAAKKMIGDLSDFAAKTPYGKQEVLDSGKMLLSYGYNAQEVATRLRSIGDVASGLNVPLKDMAYLMGTTRTQGRAMTADLNQFANRGVPIFEEVGKVLGINADKVKEYAADGKVSYQVVEAAFTNMTSQGGKFFNLMDAQSKSAGGRFATLMDTLSMRGEALGVAMLPAINAVVDMGTVLAESLTPIVAGLAPVFGFLGNNLQTILTVAAPLLAIWAGYSAWLKIVTLYQWALNAAMTANPVGLIVAGIALLVGGLIAAWQNSETFRGIILGVWEVLVMAWDTVSGFASALWEWITPVGMVKTTFEGLSSLFVTLWPVVQNVFGKIGSFISDVFGGAIDWVVGKVQTMFDWILKLADSLGLTKYVDKIRNAFNVGFEKGKDPEKPTDDTDETGALAALTGQPVTMVAAADAAKGKKKGSKGDGLDGLQGDAKVGKNMTINIEKLIESLNISSTSIQGSTEDVKRAVTETLINAVRDFELSYS